MFSLRKLMGKDDKFFDLLEASAEQSKTSIDLLAKYMEARTNNAPVSIDEFIQSRRADKKITQDITAELAKTFVTPLEREEIEALSFALYRIPKSVEKLVERYSIYRGKALNLAGVKRQVELLQMAAEAVVVMVGLLRHGVQIEKVSAAQAKLQHAEGEADKVMLGMIADLYNGPYEAKDMVILMELYEMTEKVVDRCRDAGNIVMQVMLKHS